MAPKKMPEWERAFSKIHANGWTSIGCPIKVMTTANQRAQNIVVISDEGENTAPHFVTTIRDYMRVFSIMPNIVIIRVGNWTDQLEQELRGAKIGYQAVTFNGDYYSLPNLIPLINKASSFELLMEVMATPIPVYTREQIKIAA
jgi:hypothetical protein